MKTKFKHERAPLTSIEAVASMKKKFGSRGGGRNGAKRRAEEAEHETPRQNRPPVYILYQYIIFIFLVLQKMTKLLFIPNSQPALSRLPHPYNYISQIVHCTQYWWWPIVGWSPACHDLDWSTEFAMTMNSFGRTVVPDLGTPVVSDHLLHTATLAMSQHISTLNYLRSTYTCLTRSQTVIYWLSAPVITDSAKIVK